MSAGFCETQWSTSLKKTVLKRKASAVAMAMHPPQRNDAANSQGVLRSRRSSRHSTASGRSERGWRGQTLGETRHAGQPASENQNAVWWAVSRMM
jgi:hypothetical protein